MAIPFGAAASASPTLPGVIGLYLAGKTADEVIERLWAWIKRTGRANRAAMAATWRSAPEKLPLTEVPGSVWPNHSLAELTALEAQLEVAFARKAEERLRRDLPVAMALPDRPIPAPKAQDRPAGGPSAPTGGKGKGKGKRRSKPPAPGDPGSGVSPRKAALDKIARREERYARQRQEAMMRRTLAAMDRVVLAEQSPAGAFWVRNPTVLQPFPDSLVMTGHFLPWEVLATFHPPTHPLDHCRLISRAAAIEGGLLTKRNDLDVAAGHALVGRAKAANAAVGWSGYFG